MTQDPRYYVADDEILYRLLSYPGQVYNNRLTEEAFALYHQNEDYVSVLRKIFVDSEDSIKLLGEKIKRWPNKEDKFWGYCTLIAGDIRAASNLLNVISCYTENFKAHAGIVYLNTDYSRIVNSQGAVFPTYILELNARLRHIAKDLVWKENK